MPRFIVYHGLTSPSSINPDNTLITPDQRRWEHSKGNALWHTDSSYHPQRSKYSLLLSFPDPITTSDSTVSAARASSNSYTHFADTRRAYAELPAPRREFLEALDPIIQHDLWHSRRLASPQVFKEPLPHEKALKPGACHRLIQPCPGAENADSKKKTFYLAAHAKTVLGMGYDESQKLIWELIDHCTRPEYVFSMQWLDAGDMVWWDNRQSMHRANVYAEGMVPRDVRRATVVDNGERAWQVGVEERTAAGWTPDAA
jgi:alpha-ketoglutarate-dependent 2,4-dichlorophenoxyacetate dioxygenase